ncbi:hypothetical protein SAMN05421874_12211 [Nonomuraea maritima]|uniref:Uncharacterized protein n=1 Tax=Nonomuraea maritima TaxID=683260 RepID=A0A1G9K8M2_9ACTN|nr:hypothetical protein [Nonomuraea maritima]SDL46260.1 hypothetical protein SAMN05421874_12211 [Nonomuraea maritima]
MSWRSLRSQKAGVSAQDAVRDLMALGFIEIRFTTHLLRRELAGDDLSSPLSHIERIRMIANVCHNLPGDLRPTNDRERERRAMESLKSHLRGLEHDGQAAQWVRARLDELGYDYLPLLPEHVRARLA